MNIGLVSIGTGGTGGHSTLLRRIGASLGTTHKLYLLSEYDCASAGACRNIKHIPVERREHQESLAGRLVHDSYKDIIAATKEHSIGSLIFSTFFDERILTYARDEGIATTLVTYPLRDSFAEYFITEGFDRKFDNVLLLNDLSGTERYRRSENTTRVAYLQGEPVPRENSIPEKTIMVQCGGGGRPSSKMFLEKIDKLVARSEQDLPDYHFIISTGMYCSGINHETPNSTVVRWIPDWQAQIRKATAVISEAGYFTMHELISNRVPAILIPGARRVDNQELRAIEYKNAGMGLAIMPQQSDGELFNAMQHIIDENTNKEMRRRCEGYIAENLVLSSIDKAIRGIHEGR